MNEELFESYFRGTLSAAERDRFKNLLEYNAGVRAEFVRYSLERAMLVRSAGRLAGLRGVEFARTPEQAPELSVAAWGFRRVVALAASLLFLAGMGTALYYLRYPTLARLTAVSGEVVITYGDKVKQAKLNHRLISGMEIETRGRGSQAVIELRDQSMIRLPGEGRLMIARRDGRQELRLFCGSFEANFQKQPAGKPLMIVTPQAQSEIVGTSIKIETTPVSTRLEVVEGHVRLKRLADGKSAEVRTRQAVVAADAGRDMETHRFCWADRFSGGEGGDRLSDRTYVADAILRREQEHKRRAAVRFKGGE